MSESFLSSQSHKPLESEASQSHLKFFSSQSQSHDLVESSHFESLICKLEPMSSHTKFHVFSTTFFCYEMAPDKLQNCAHRCFKKFVCRLFISELMEIAFYLSLSLSVISKSLAQLGASVGFSFWCRNPMWRFGVLPSVDVACEECCCCMQRCWFPQTLPTRQSSRSMSTDLTPD